MSKVLYEFSPNTNVVKGPHAPDSPIVIQAYNVTFSDVISKQFMNSGIKDFINYVKSFPLRYAFYNFVDPFYPKQFTSCDPSKYTLRQCFGVGWKYLSRVIEDDDENNDEDNEEGVDDEEEANELATDKGEAFVHGMNSPPILNKHIRLCSTSSSTTSTNDIVQRGSSPPKIEPTDPLIQDVTSQRSMSHSPQAATAPPMLMHIQTASFYQGESSSNFQTTMIFQLSLLV
ncbi:unnamed protein product [Lactuca saligna]|uniref:Uncharacterized protein n=1 Tax=Lactuca saligna TaxID=75948 RepID=A0AA36E8G1_LACSI|nr:unnamed protein product [Lactuca saligna]